MRSRLGIQHPRPYPSQQTSLDQIRDLNVTNGGHAEYFDIVINRKAIIELANRLDQIDDDITRLYHRGVSDE